MNGACHRTDTFSSYSFSIFGGDWAKLLEKVALGAPSKGDTIIGNDVWIGYEVTIMPGVKIGDGSIIASKSVVASDVPPYTIYGGNPAKIIRKRFSDDIIQLLLDIQWWNWSYDKITNNIDIIFSADIQKLKKIKDEKDSL